MVSSLVQETLCCLVYLNALYRSSVVRAIRERSETKMTSAMKNPAILMPSGRSMTLTTVV